MLTFLQNIFSKATEKQLVFFWVVFCFVALAYKLDGVPPYHSDENYYVESTRNMVESGDYLTPVYRDEKRFAKPILYYWLMSASYKVFGVNLVSARLTSVIFGALTIGLLYLFSSRLFQGRVALYSALILPATYLHFQISRWATTDIVMNFFVLLAFYFFVRLYQGDFKLKKDAWLFYLAMALGFMIKGPPAIIIPGVVLLIFILATGRREALFKMHVGQGLIILLLVIVPWFATMLFLHGAEFKNHIVGAEIKNRLAHDTPFSFYYVGVLFRYYLPWILFFVAAVFFQFGRCSPASGSPEYSAWNNLKSRFKALFSRENEPVLLCYIWVLVCLVLFTLVRTEHSRYMLPASPAIAILVAKFFTDMEKIGFSWRGYRAAVVLTGLIFLVIAVVSGVGLYGLGIIYQTPVQYFLLPAVFLVAGIGIFRFAKQGQCGIQVLIISGSLVFGFSFLSGDVLPHVNRYPMKLFSERILSQEINDPIAVYRLGNQRAKLGVLTGQKSFNLSQPGQIQQFMDVNGKVLVVMREKDFQESFSDTPLKVVAEDTAWLRGHVDWRKMKELLGKTESANISGLTEKIYLLSNR